MPKVQNIEYRKQEDQKIADKKKVQTIQSISIKQDSIKNGERMVKYRVNKSKKKLSLK